MVLQNQNQYLSRVSAGLRGLEEGVGQLPHPHRNRRRLPGRLAGVHHPTEQGLQLLLRVPADVHDLPSAPVRVHVARSRSRSKSPKNKTKQTP